MLLDQTEALLAIWERCGKPESEKNLFLASCADLPHSAKISRIAADIDSCTSAQIVLQREKILNLWESLKVGTQERSLFSAFRDKCTSQEVLCEHDILLSELQHRYTAAEPLLKQIEKYEILLQERDALTAATEDPLRLVDRHTNSFVWRKAEDRLHLLSHKILPERKQVLFNDISKWEAETRESFLVWGERYLDSLCFEFNFQGDTCSLDPAIGSVNRQRRGLKQSAQRKGAGSVVDDFGGGDALRKRQEVLRIQYKGRVSREDSGGVSGVEADVRACSAACMGGGTRPQTQDLDATSGLSTCTSSVMHARKAGALLLLPKVKLVDKANKASKASG
jgi:hypothetical protein